MNLLYLSNHIRGPRGQAGARTWHQVKCLSASHAVTVLVPRIDPVTQQPVTEFTYSGLDSSAVEVVPLGANLLNRSSKLSKLLFYVSAALASFLCGLKRKEVDVVITMSLPLTLLCASVLLSKVKRKPLIVDLRDLPFETASDVGYVKSSYFINVCVSLENIFLKVAHRIVVNSPRYKKILCARGLDRSKIEVAMIGYDAFEEPSSEDVTVARTQLLEKFHEDTKEIVIFTGTLGDVIPVHHLLDAAELQMKNGSHRIGWLIVGDGQHYESYIHRYGKVENVVFTGRVDKSEVSLLCRSSDLCVYPSVEGRSLNAMLGNKIFDYLGAKKPVLFIGPDSAVGDLIQQFKFGESVDVSGAERVLEAMNGTLDRKTSFMSYSKEELSELGLTAAGSATILKRIIDDLQ